jgi:hypothetical protein
MLAIVTGASRGIGEAYAHQLAARGYSLYVVGRDRERLAQVAKDIRLRYGSPVEEIVLDLASLDSAERLYAEVRSRQDLPVDLLVNNAGFGLYGEFSERPMLRVQEMLALHVLTTTKLMRLFLPEMRERRRGVIINVASVTGLLPMPYMAVYAATKAYLVNLGLSLEQEARPYGVIIQTCCPGQTATEFHRTAGRIPPTAPGGRQTAAQVAAESLAALDRGQTLIITGFRNRLLIQLQKLIPRQWLLSASARSLKS